MTVNTANKINTELGASYSLANVCVCRPLNQYSCFYHAYARSTQADHTISYLSASQESRVSVCRRTMELVEAGLPS